MSSFIRNNTGADLVRLPENHSLVVRQQSAAQQAKNGIVAVINTHIGELCSEMRWESDRFRLRYLRMEIEENEERKRITKRLFAQFWRREKALILAFLRYRKGLLGRAADVLELAAEIDGLSTTALKSNYEQFRNLVLDEWKLEIAEQVTREIYVHELQQLADQVDTVHAPEIERRLTSRRRRFARRALKR